MEASTGAVRTATDSSPSQPDPELGLSKGRAAVEKVAQAADSRDSKRELEALGAETHADALEWLLSDEAEDEAVGLKTLEVDISGPGSPPRWVRWTIKPIGADEMKEARKRAQGGLNRAERRRSPNQDIELSEVNLHVLVAATVEPDLVAAAQTKGIADPSVIVRHRFRRKPGLVDQLANEVYAISGYEDEVVRDAPELRAARG
jgi:hypothetical protein